MLANTSCFVRSTLGAFAFLRGAQANPNQPQKPKVERTRWGALEVARAAVRGQHYDQAQSRYHEIIQVARRQRDKRNEARALCELAFVYSILGDLDSADCLYKESYVVWKELRLASTSPGFCEYLQFLMDYAEFLRKAGKPLKSYQLLHQVESMSLNFQPLIQFSRAKRLESRGQDLEAEKLFEEALISAGLKNDIELQLRVLDRLILLYQRVSKPYAATAMLERRHAINEFRNYLLGEERQRFATAQRYEKSKPSTRS